MDRERVQFVKYSSESVMYRERESACIKFSSVNVMYTEREKECMRQVQLCERDVQRVRERNSACIKYSSVNMMYRERERVHASSTAL